MSKLLAIGFVAVSAVASASSADIITQWAFPAGFDTQSPVPSTGAGVASLISPLTGAAAQGSDGVNVTAWNTLTYRGQGTGSGLAGVRFNVSTVGNADIVVSFDQRASNTASRFTRFEYTTDGTNFTTAGLVDGGVLEFTTGANVWNARSFDLSAIAAADNNPNFGFRIVAIFAPSTSAYAAATTTSTYATNGTLRYDLVTVTPTPGAAALLGLGGLMASRRRR